MVFGNPLREIRRVGGESAVELGNAADQDGQNQQVQVSIENGTGRGSCQECGVCRKQSMGLVSVTSRAATAIRTAAAAAGGGATNVLLGWSLALARWGRADESVVDAQSLVKELAAVQVLDCLGGFGEGRVLDQGVSLALEIVSKSPFTITVVPAAQSSNID